MNPIDVTSTMRFDDDVTTAATVDEKLADAMVPGFMAEFAPDEAELAGAFAESALSEHDARESAVDFPAAMNVVVEFDTEVHHE